VTCRTGLINSAGLGAADLRILCQTLPGLIRIWGKSGLRGGCPRTLRLMMAASLTMRTKVDGKAPPVVFRRGFGVRGGGLVVSLP
jgi:hypothetical protein